LPGLYASRRCEFRHDTRGARAIFTFAKDVSNIRNITIQETGSGAIVGLALSGIQDADSSVESITLRVLIEYRKDQQNDIEMIKHLALRQAMKVLQHEITLSQAKANARAVRW
jgi:hypothetical protein